MNRNISRWLTAAAAFGLAAGAMAAPYLVTYTDTVSTPTVLGIINGQEASIKLVLDNGNSSVASQTWTAANVQCAIFTFNNAQNLFMAINYAGMPFTNETIGNFTTNPAGVLQTAPGSWVDFPVVASNVVTNIASPVSEWFIDGVNNVLFLSSQIGFTNVANDIIAANWSNPVPFSGVCGAPRPALVQSAIPTLTPWGMVMLSGLLALGVVISLRRRRR